jgi:hypothetical protein
MSTLLTTFDSSTGNAPNVLFGGFSFGVDEYVGRPQALGFLFGTTHEFPTKIGTPFDDDAPGAKSADVSLCLKSQLEQVSPGDPGHGKLYFAFYRNETDTPLTTRQYDGSKQEITLVLHATAEITFNGATPAEWEFFFANGHLDICDPPVLELDFQAVSWIVSPEAQKVDFPIASFRRPMRTFYSAEWLLEQNAEARLGLVVADGDMDYPSFIRIRPFTVL